MMKLIAALAAATFLCAAAPAGPAPAGQDDILPICERALAAAIDGADPRAVVDQATRTMPDSRKRLVLTVCAIYLSGAIAMARHAGQAPRLPAGGTAI